MITFSRLGQFGRLGNQLFQIASTIGIALDNKTTYSFPTWKYNPGFINTLPLDTNNQKNVRSVVYYDTAFKKFELSDPDVVYDLQGYFQSYKYFDEYKDIINHYFYFESPVANISVAKDFIAIHVRRGDYTGLTNIHPVLPMEYYHKAMSYFPNETFIVYSDDPEWCKQNFSRDKCIIMEPCENDLVDLIMMRDSKGIITANSSYSWWSAYLSKNIPIICPRIWALNEPTNSWIDRIPGNWGVLDYEY